MPALNVSPRQFGRGVRPDLRRRDIILVGDSLTDASVPSGGYRWGLPFARSPGRVVYNSGVYGDTLDSLWARWQTTVIDKMPQGGVIFLRIGTNSAGGSDFNDKYMLFVNDVISRPNFRMVMFAIPPRGGMSSALVVNNAFIASCASLSPRLFYIQDSLALADADYNVDDSFMLDPPYSVHMNPKGIVAQGLAMQGPLVSWMGPAPDPRPTTGDNRGSNPASSQWVPNPLMAGTGTNATSWGVGAVGAGTAMTPSLVAADVDDPNQTPWQRGTIDAIGGGGHSVGFSTTLLNPAMTAGSSPAYVETVAEVRFVNINPAHLFRFTISMQYSTAVFPGWGGDINGAEPLFPGGLVNKTMLFHYCMARDPAGTMIDVPANSIPFGISFVTEDASASPCGAVDIRCLAVYGRDSL